MAEPGLLRGNGARKIFAVARYEFISTITRLGYLLTLVGMPLFIVAVGAFSGLATSRLMVEQMARPKTIGVVDDSGLFAGAPLKVEAELNLEKLPIAMRSGVPEAAVGAARVLTAAELRRFASLEEARPALLRGELQSVVRIPRNYLATGKLEEFRRGGRRGFDLAGGAGGAARYLRQWLVRGLLTGRVDAALAERVARPADWSVFLLEPDGSIEEQDLIRELRPFLVPLCFSLLLMLSIFTSASYLATGLAEEKQNRALELMLTSLTPEQLFWGKLLGLWLAALLQFLLYLFAVALPAALLFVALGLHLSQALVGFCYFVLGFFFFGAVLLAVGALGNTQKYTQQLSGVFTFTAVVPFMIAPALLNQPGGVLARVLTYVPFTAPITGMLRSAAGALPWWELLLSLTSLGLGASLVIRASARIFRIALLSTGNAPSLKQVLAWLRE